MSADFKSHVLLRDEKGFLGIPFKRLILAAVGGGLVYSLVRFASSEASLPLGVAAGIALLILTGLQGGLPLWLRLTYRLRGWLLTGAAAQAAGVFGQVATSLNLPLDLYQMDSIQIFAPAETEVIPDLHEWMLFTSPTEADAGDGLAFVTAPLEDV